MNQSKSIDGFPSKWLCAGCTAGRVNVMNTGSPILAGLRAETRRTDSETYVAEAGCEEETCRTSALLAALLMEICKAWNDEELEANTRGGVDWSMGVDGVSAKRFFLKSTNRQRRLPHDLSRHHKKPCPHLRPQPFPVLCARKVAIRCERNPTG
jgi:hypothetical protein